MDKPEERVVHLATLVYPVRDEVVLLAEKMDKIGKGYLNGWGGKKNETESLRDCAVREFFEETGGARVKEEDLSKVGIVHFKNHNDGVVSFWTVHVYTLSRWTGDIVSTKEMRNPRWILKASIPNEKLMLADKFWLPQMLRGEKGLAFADYGPNQQTLLSEVVFKPLDVLQEE